MAYRGPEDQHFYRDLSIALKGWHKARLGSTPLVANLPSLKQRLAADLGLQPAAAVQQAIRAGMDRLGHTGSAEHSALLERRFVRGETIPELCHAYLISERALYYRLKEATKALAKALWALEGGALDRGPAGQVALDTPDGPALIPPSLPQASRLPPPTYTRLFGVERTLAQLVERLHDPADHWLISVEGMGGLGKTALAREAAGRLAAAARFTGIAWVTAKQEYYTWRGLQQSTRPALTFEQLLDNIIDQLDASGSHPLSVPAKREHVRRLVKAHPYLVVVDNLEAILDCETLPDQLWELANPTKFLFTSRHQVGLGNTDWVTVSALSLDQLAEADALDLLRYEAHLRGVDDVAQAPADTLVPLITATGGHPLAIKLVAGQLAHLSIHRILAGLQATDQEQDQFREYLYRPSWALLSTPARRLLLLIALLPASGAVWEDLAALSGLPDAKLDAALGELTGRSLLQAGGLPDKVYTLHPLTRRFVSTLPEQAAAFGVDAVRVGEYYLAYARQNQEDWAVLGRRQEQILQAIDLCVEAGPEGQRIVVDLALLLGQFVRSRGWLSAWLPYLDLAIQAAGALGDEASQANLWNQQGMLLGVEGDQEPVLARHCWAAEVFERLGDKLNLARTLRLLGNAHYTRADRRAALACYEQARDLLTGLPAVEPRELYYIYNNIACVYAEDQDWPQSLVYYEQALALLDPDRDRLQITALLTNIGQLRCKMGCWRQAIADLLRALPFQQADGDLVGQITSHQYLCLSYAGLEDCGKARSHSRQALQLATMLGSPNTRAHLYTDLAAAYLDMDDSAEAREYLALAEPLWRQLRSADGLSRACLVTGDRDLQEGAWAEAEAAYRDTLALLEDRKEHEPRRVLAMLGLARARAGAGDRIAGLALLPLVQSLAASLTRPDLQARALWLQAELQPDRARQALEAALALCGAPGAGNERLDRLRRDTQARLEAAGLPVA